MQQTADGGGDPRLGGPIRRRPKRRGARDEPGVSQDPRVRGEPRPRRFEPFPRWGYVLLAVTAVVTPVGVYLAFRGHVGAGGTSCGAALFPTGHEGDAIASSACTQVIADAQPWALAVGALALVLVMTSITTLIVRGWIAREASTPD